MQVQIALVCGTLRLIHALLLRTYFNPDEYWQCLEPAHQLVFGYGHRTWEWAAGLRGYLHPVLFALLYKGLQVVKLDTNWAVAHAPQLMQAAFAAVTDVYVYKLALLLYGKPSARWTLLCQLTNWFNAYCLVRTYSNSFEALCTVVGVFYWLASRTTHLSQPIELLHSSHRIQSQADFSSSNSQVTQPVQSPHSSKQGAWLGLQPKHSPARRQQGQHQPTHPCSPVNNSGCLVHSSTRKPWITHRQKALWAAAVGVLFRPSSLLFWAPLGVNELRSCRAKWGFILEAALIGGCTLLMGTLVDRLGYGRWVLVPWEFAKFNLFQAGSAMYGSHPWHWNFSQGFPTIMLTHLPLAIGGVYLSRGRFELAALVLWSLMIYSLPAHKEFRFLLPALLLLMPYCGIALDDLASRWSQHSATADTLLHQAVFSKVRKDELRPHQGPASKKWAFSLDRSAIDKARQLSRLLDEAPQEGGCPFVVSTDVMPEPLKGRSCPFSSGRDPTAQEDMVYATEDSVCRFSAANPASVMPAPDRAAVGTRVSSCLQADVSSHLQQPKAAAKCPFHFEQGDSSPMPSLPHKAPEFKATPTEEQSLIGGMTEEELKEYEQAFAVEPNEAMLQAYAALLADKVAEADRDPDDIPQRASGKSTEADRTADYAPQYNDHNVKEADRKAKDTPQCRDPGHMPGHFTQLAYIQPPAHVSCHTSGNAVPFPEADHGKHCHVTEASSSRAYQATAQTSSAQMTEASSAPAAAAASDRMTNHSPCSCGATALKAFKHPGLHSACQQSMSRVRSCCDYLRQQPLRWHVLMTICFGIQLVMTLYFSLVHQRGQVDVMHYLGHEAQLQPSMRVLFLTPCHATPWFSHVHANISMDFLDCSPPGWAEATRCLNTPGCSVQGSKSPDRHNALSQHEYGLFRDDPLQVLQSRWGTVEKHSRPTHLVMFQDLVPDLSRYIAEQGFALQKTFFNCHVQVDAGSKIWLWKHSM